MPPSHYPLILVITLLSGSFSSALMAETGSTPTTATEPAATPAPIAPIWQEHPEIAALLTEAGVQGTFVLSCPGENTLHGTNAQRAAQQYLPASTFKIPNSLIAFETGVVNIQEIFHHDGKPKRFKGWEQDMDIKTALAVSNVPIYQEIARRIGYSRMAEWVHKADYGNQNIGDSQNIDRFWLDGPLKISAIEQARFLNRLYQQQLPFSKTSMTKVMEIMPVVQGEKGKILSKTGWTDATQPGIGWLVGWVVQPQKTCAFALNIDIGDQWDEKTDLPVDVAKRMPLAQATLKQLGLF